MRKIRVNGEDYSSSLDETELAFIGPLSLPTGINSLSEGIVKHEEDINELNSNIGVKTLAGLGLTTPCTIRQIVEALPYGASVVISISTGNVSDLNTTGELYIRTAASSSVLHKTDLVFRSNTASATSLDGRYLIGMLPGTGNAKWYKPTITEVTIS